MGHRIKVGKGGCPRRWIKDTRVAQQHIPNKVFLFELDGLRPVDFSPISPGLSFVAEEIFGNLEPRSCVIGRDYAGTIHD